MATGTVEYIAPVAGVRVVPIQVSNSHPVVENIVLETQDGKRLEITSHLTDVFALEEARTIVEGILPSIVNRLAFHRKVSVGEPYFTGASGRSPIARAPVLLRCEWGWVAEMG